MCFSASNASCQFAMNFCLYSCFFNNNMPRHFVSFMAKALPSIYSNPDLLQKQLQVLSYFSHVCENYCHFLKQKTKSNLFQACQYKQFFHYIQSTLVISTSVISNHRLSRRENLVLVLTQISKIRLQNIVEKRRNCSWGAISPLFHNIFNIYF